MCLFYFLYFVIILLCSWKLHTGINRSSRSSLGHRPSSHPLPCAGCRGGAAGRGSTGGGASAGPPLQACSAAARLPPAAVRAITGEAPVRKELPTLSACVSEWGGGGAGQSAPELGGQPWVYVSTSV